jgi:aminopeptidase
MADVDSQRVEALGALAVEVGANVAEGQTVIVRGHLADAPLVRAIVRAAYRRGAHQVDVDFEDPLVRRIRLQEVVDDRAGSRMDARHPDEARGAARRGDLTRRRSGARAV